MTTLNEHPRTQLQLIIARFGHSVCDDPKRCEAMLRDLCPEHKREVNLLVTALKEKIVHELLNRSALMPLEATLKSLSQRLQDNHGTAEPFADWVVESWALSLAVIQKPLPNQSVKSVTNNSTTQTATSSSPKQQRIGKFIVRDGITLDTETNLIWCRFAYGQRWQNGTAVGDAKLVEWKTVFEVVKQFNQQSGCQGYTDWRLPMIDELKTLIDKVKGRKGNYIDADVFPSNNSNCRCYWSFSSAIENKMPAIDFTDGQFFYAYRDSSFTVRLVRTKQPPAKARWV